MFNFSLSPHPISACPEIIFACVWFIPLSAPSGGRRTNGSFEGICDSCDASMGKKKKKDLKSPELLIAHRVLAPTVPQNVPTVFLANLELTLIPGSNIPHSRAFLCFKECTLSANKVTHVFKTQGCTPSLFLLKTAFP